MSLNVSLREGEGQESLIKRFQKTIQMDGVLREWKDSQIFLSKRDARNLKSKRAARRKNKRR